MLGRAVSILHRPETVQQFPTIHARMMQGQQGFSGETTLVRKNGEHFPALFAAYPLINEQGLMWGALGVSVDITRQKQVEQALRESEERFKELAQLLPETIYEISLDGRILFLNQSGLQQFRLTEEDLHQGLNAYSFFPPNEQQKLQENLAILASGKPTGLSEYVVTRKDGSELPVMARSSPIIDHGAVVGVRGFLIDISEKKRLEEQLHLAQRMEAVGTLAGGIAHDFNNILMAIQGLSSLMQMGLDSNNPLAPQLRKIDDLVASAAGLTRQLLGFARSGKYNPRATNLNSMIIKTADMFGRTKKELRIIKRLDEDLWTVCIDQGQIEQVLLNLMINAWQAMPNGGELTLVTANHFVDAMESERLALPPGRYAQVSVTDTGSGMDQETQQHIFEPFFTTKAKEFGTGLGLASAYGILDNHKGAITVQSEPGLGSTFTFYLPAVDAAAEEPALPTTQLLSGQATILLIDDEPFITAVESAILENLGHTVRVCNSGEEALAYYRDHHQHIDLVILDIVMPGMNGEETYLGLRAIDPEVKVLLASGYSIEGQAAKLLQMGCKGFLQKPFTSSLLSRKVMEILQGAPASPDNVTTLEH
jgi:PAS domain S-box-containing protein